MTSTLKVVLAGSILAIAATAASAEGRSCPAHPGRPADQRSFGREIVLKPTTRWANVTEGEVVRFVVRSTDGTEGSFTWDFDTFGERNFDLRCLAPEGMLQRTVTVYIAADARYYGS